MNCRCAVALTVLVAASSPAAAEQSTPAGRIKIVTGTAFVIHETQERPARIGDVVYETDSLTTGPDGRIGVTLRDETESRWSALRSSPRSLPVLARRRSTRACPQGRSRPGDVCLGPDCEALADAARLETPAAIVGVRGTRIAIRVGNQSRALPLISQQSRGPHRARLRGGVESP